jgi:hypothetical protein
MSGTEETAGAQKSAGKCTHVRFIPERYPDGDRRMSDMRRFFLYRARRRKEGDDGERHNQKIQMKPQVKGHRPFSPNPGNPATPPESPAPCGFRARPYFFVLAYFS